MVWRQYMPALVGLQENVLFELCYPSIHGLFTGSHSQANDRLIVTTILPQNTDHMMQLGVSDRAPVFKNTQGIDNISDVDFGEPPVWIAKHCGKQPAIIVT